MGKASKHVIDKQAKLGSKFDSVHQKGLPYLRRLVQIERATRDIPLLTHDTCLEQIKCCEETFLHSPFQDDCLR
jgi:hypothetical protein